MFGRTEDDFTGGPAAPPIPPTRTFSVYAQNEGMGFQRQMIEAHNLVVEDGCLAIYLIIGWMGNQPIISTRGAWARGEWKSFKELSAPLTEQSLIVQ